MVQNFVSERSGKPISNQFILDARNVTLTFKQAQGDLTNPYKADNGDCQHIVSSGEIFQSYRSNVAFISYRGQKFINRKFYKYSNTTSKYLAKFFNSNSKEIEKDITNGNIRLCEDIS